MMSIELDLGKFKSICLSIIIGLNGICTKKEG